MDTLKTPKQMERHLKGIANHYRIEILLFVADRAGSTLEDIIRELGANKKTLGEHTRRLYQRGDLFGIGSHLMGRYLFVF